MLNFVSAPYTHKDQDVVEWRIQTFVEEMTRQIQMGRHPVSPLMNHLLKDRSKLEFPFPLTWDYWKDYSLKLLSKCDYISVLMFPGWEDSKGVESELEMALNLGIPVEYVRRPEWR